MSMSRRRFLGAAGGAVVASAVGVGAWEGLLRDHIDDRPHAAPKPGQSGASGKLPAPADRVLVVLQLTGGNDGLNTLIPVDGRYHDARPTIGVADADLVHLDGETGYGLAPELAPLGALWKAGRLAALDGVGFAGASHSHFQALDWWWSATPGTTSATGWLGRWLDATAGDAKTANPLRGIALGAGAPMVRAQHAMATVINDPNLFNLKAPTGVDGAALVEAFKKAGAPAGGASQSLDTLARGSMLEVTGAVDRLAPVGIGTPNPAAARPGGKRGGAKAGAAVGGGGGTATEGLDLAAKLIGLNLGTRVIAVGTGGYDTHAGEATSHKALLTDLAGGLKSFFDTIDKSGHGDRVLVLTTSEFGRRVQENGSGGTDHGAGSVQFVVGSGVNRKVQGSPDLAHLTAEGDVQPAIDTRSLFSTGLDWLGGPTAQVLGKQYDTFGLLKT